jgi:hypothetical protein
MHELECLFESKISSWNPAPLPIGGESGETEVPEGGIKAGLHRHGLDVAFSACMDGGLK